MGIVVSGGVAGLLDGHRALRRGGEMSCGRQAAVVGRLLAPGKTAVGCAAGRAQRVVTALGIGAISKDDFLERGVAVVSGRACEGCADRGTGLFSRVLIGLAIAVLRDDRDAVVGI